MESMDIIDEALRFPPDAVADDMGRRGRRVAVELRKLLFDSRPLLHHVLERPRFQPLKKHETLTGDIYENECVMSIAAASSDGVSLGGVATHKWHIRVHPLHGLRFDGISENWTFYPMFDTGAVPITLERWLRQRLFCVDDREYSLLDTLKFIANKEAVHVDIAGDGLQRDMERVHFGHTTYYQIVAVLTAAYLSAEYWGSRQANKDEWQNFGAYKRHTAIEPNILWGGELSNAKIDPLGLPHVFHETGISIPNPGETWNPVHLEEYTVVYS